jgi:hypothetical protein
MNPKPWSTFSALPKLLYTHNPLYLLSALCVLYGMNRVVVAAAPSVGGPLLMGLLGGYTVPLAVVAYLIVRFGQVWDDARTILLVLVLLLAALSVGFDRTVLDDPLAGGKLLLSGLLFSVAVSEGVLWSLRIRLPARYRVPYYLLLTLLFGYPIWLGHLSFSGHDSRIALAVFLFPVVAGLALLMLLPAARRHDRRGRPNGTPWQWPGYPWALFIVLFVALIMRSYSLGMSFESGHGTENSFRPYFLLPILLAGAALLLELAVTARNTKAQLIALAMPAALLWLAIPGHGSIQADRFLGLLSETIASPAQLTVYCLIAFYLIAWLRGFRWGEIGVMVFLALSAIIDRRTYDVHSLVAAHWLPLAIIATIEISAAAWQRSSGRLMVGIVAAGITLGRLSWVSIESPASQFYAWHGGILAVLLLAGLFDDDWARWLRRFAFGAIPLAAIWAAAANENDFPEVPRFVHDSYLAGLVALSALYWYREAGWQRMAAVAVSFAALAGANLRWLYLALEGSPLGGGLPWLAWGVGSLAGAICISLLKAGILTRRFGILRSNDDHRPLARHLDVLDKP